MPIGTLVESTQTLTGLIRHIVDKHHDYMRAELPWLEERLGKMCRNHGQDRPELFTMQQLLQDLRDDIMAHLSKEESVLFPYIAGLEAAQNGGEPPHACFPSVQFPIRVMVIEHDRADNILRQLRAASGNYTTPAGFCENGAEFYQRLGAMETDLKEHIRLENDILFPRAVQLEGVAR